MAGSRYSLIPKAFWQYLGPAYRGLDADLSALESGKADKTSLATVAFTGKAADLIGGGGGGSVASRFFKIQCPRITGEVRVA